MSLSESARRFPLSLSQLNILNLERVLAGTSVNNISTTVRIVGRLDFPILQQSISLVIERDPSLRTRLVEENGEILQYHAPFEKESFPVYDFSNTSKEGIENWENAVTRELIGLFDGPLYRFVLFRDSENSGGVLVKLHHIIADGWSQIMLCNKIGRTYLDLLKGNEPDLPISPDYELHILEEQEYLLSKAYEKDERYWKDVVDLSSDPASFKSVNSSAISSVGRRISFDLPDILNHAIYTYCLKNAVAPFAVFYMALAIYFKRNGGADKFTIGVPIFNRTSYEFKQTTGMFVTTLPFYNEINDKWSLDQFNEELAERWFEMLRHQRYPFSKICELAGKEGRLFNIALSYQDSKIFESPDASVIFSGRWHYCGYQAEQLTIHLTNLKNHRKYAVDYDYLAQFFTENEIAELHKNLCHILSESLSEPDRPIYKLNILSLEQKEELLYKFNRTDRNLEERSVYKALLDNNARHLNRVALIHAGERMTYGTLFYRSTQLASELLSRNIEGLVAVLLPRNFDLFFAMLGAVQINCAYMLLSESLPTDRIKNILTQSGASAVITDAKGKVRIEGYDIPVVCMDDVAVSIPLISADKTVNDGEALPGDNLAYVVYTSGSTGEPKGVEITQRNLLNLAQEMENVYGQGAVLSVSNVGFDAFMLESIVALLNGRTIVLPLESDLESPETLATLMNSYAVDFFSMTPSRLSALIQNSTFRKVMWRMESIVCGGENFPHELLKKLKSCTKARIYNQYGPSETTVAVSMKEISRTDKITIGTPMGNCKLYILDQWMNPLPIGGNGRLFVGGKCVGRGYRNRPDLTEKAFRDNPFINDDVIYDTGDMAYWTPGGEVMLTGRADRQIKLNGLRIELQEISSCIESYPGVSCAYARVCEIGDNKIIGAYYSSDAEISESNLREHAATYLPSYMIPVFFIRVDKFATTPNGKINEDCLPMPHKTQDVCIDVSQSAMQIAQIFRDVLRIDDIHATSDYFLCGGNSLNALESIIKIEEALGVRVRVSDLYACRSAVKLAELIDGTKYATVSGKKTKPRTVATLQKAPKNTKYSLTPIQKGIYVQSMLDPSGLSYNMPGAFMLENEPDVDKLLSAFKNLVSDDAIFRTAFVGGTNGVNAVVADSVDFELEYISAKDFESAAEIFVRPFDLSCAPLLRAGIWRSEDNKFYLFVDSHHIIGDGMSSSIVLQRLDAAYRGVNGIVDWNYYDYVHAEENADTSSKKESLAYWVERLKDMPEALNLPSDFARQKRFDYKGSQISHRISEVDAEKIKRFCVERGYSEYVLFLAAYGLLLSKVSGCNDMIIGTPVIGRTRAEYAQICGPFINTLPIRLTLYKQLTISDWLKTVQKETTDMLDHQHTGLEDIISALGLERGEQNSLYKVMMSHSPVDEESFSLGDQKMSLRSISTNSAKMDLVLELVNKQNTYDIRISYATSLFEEDTVSFYGRCIEHIVKEFVKNVDKTIDGISVISPIDKEKIIDQPNYKTTPFLNRPLHHIIKNRSLAFSDDVALIYHGEEITYAHLEKRACAIAQFVENEGIMPGQCVGICLERTPDLIATMYGVLKAGCAYMLMLSNFPAERIKYMLDISKAALLICDNFPEGLQESSVSCKICSLPSAQAEVDEYIDRHVTDSSLFNVHFTSGSTGRPKGVMICHRSMSNLYAMVKDLIEPYEGRFLCSTQAVFDCFVVETLVSLAIGRTVVLADSEEMMLPWKLAGLMENYDTGIFEMTPSRLGLYFENEAFCRAASKIKLLMVGGEVLNKPLMDKFYHYSDGTLLNMYGPSEATVYTTMGIIPADNHITIGSQVMNTRVYVVDEDLKPVMPTAIGELCVAGESLAKGYISSDELTAKSFVDDIFNPECKMYRSGDLVRLRVDGTFDYIGRKDSQIKLNGQRVEIFEITSAIEDTGLAKQAATVAIRNKDSSMQLYSFYSSVNGEDKGEDIRANIAKILPDYMIPSMIIRLDELPTTATNKIDLTRLAQMAQNNEFSMPETESVYEKTEESAGSDKITCVEPDVEYVLSVWNRVLNTPIHDPSAEFFKNGGTSMAALSVLSYYYSDGFEMALSEFYENVTANDQANLLSDRKKNSVVQINSAENPEAIGDKDKLVLVTGATGFFGIHLVKELIDAGETKILCLIRDHDGSRIKEKLVWYFGEDAAERIYDSIIIVSGDITDSKLGLSEDQYEKLVNITREVFHSAADVRHYADDEESYMRTNVEGTKNMMELCKQANASFYHMSTLSVSGNGMKNGYPAVNFTENDHDIGQIWENNIYVKSKFLAEKAVLDAAKEGLRCKIFRLGRLVGRMSDGKFQINFETNAFYLLLKGIMQVGALPIDFADVKTDVMPVDLAAREVIALRTSDGITHHIMNFDPPAFIDILEAAIGDITVTDMECFRSIFKEKLMSMDRQLIAIIFSKLSEEASHPTVAQVTAEITKDNLNKLNFDIPKIQLENVFKNFCKGE